MKIYIAIFPHDYTYASVEVFTARKEAEQFIKDEMDSWAGKSLQYTTILERDV